MHAGKFALRAAVLDDALFALLGASGGRSKSRPISTTPLASAATACRDSPRRAPTDKSRSLFVAADHFANSVHGEASVRCTDCHTTITDAAA